MAFPKFNSGSSLSLIGVVLLVGGLGVAIFASQQQQDQRSEAASVGDHIVNNVTLPVTSASGYTATGLIVDAEYKIVVSGTFQFNSDGGTDRMWADAQWVARNCNPCSTSQYTQSNHAVIMDGKQPAASDKGSSGNSSHTYTWYRKATATSMTFGIADSNYSDNTGSLKLNMYINKLPITPTKTPTLTPTKKPTPTPTITPTLAPKTTTFTFDLLLHGIGKGGDNRNPDGGGNPNPLSTPRSVFVDVYDLDDNLVVTKQGSVAFDSASGSYKGSVAMGTTLTSGAYQIKVKLSHSLRGTISRNITAGTTNVIPQMTLVNGDANNDALLDIVDYNIIIDCYSDFDLPPADCDVTKRAQADIDDDGKVNQFDLNLFLREMSVQEI